MLRIFMPAKKVVAKLYELSLLNAFKETLANYLPGESEKKMRSVHVLSGDTEQVLPDSH